MSDNPVPGVIPPPNTSGLNIQPVPQGPLVSVLHTERQMMIFGVTENELRTLTIVNAAIAFLFSLGSACFGYLLNLQADIAFADKITPQTAAILNVIDPGLKWLGIAFWGAGIVAWFMRSSFINTIKRESDPQRRQAKRQVPYGRVGRAWAAFWS